MVFASGGDAEAEHAFRVFVKVRIAQPKSELVFYPSFGSGTCWMVPDPSDFGELSVPTLHEWICRRSALLMNV